MSPPSTADLPASTGRRSPGLAGGVAIVAIGLMVAQVATYAVNLVAARVLGAANFGALATLLTLLAIGNVVALAVQAVAARRLVLLAAPSKAGAGWTAIKLSVAAGLGVAAATLIVGPFAVSLLHLPGFLSVALVGVALIPLTAVGSVLGVAQGHERPHALAASYVVTGLGKALGAIVAVIITHDVTATMLGLAIGSTLGLLAGFVVVRGLVRLPAIAMPGVVHEAGHASHALFALFVFTSVDLLLARHFLVRAESGLYAVGAVVSRVAFWLPQTVVVVAFTRLADGRRQRTLLIGAGACAALGAGFTIGCALFPALAVRIVGGAGYEALAPTVWLFALAGALESLAQYLLYSRLAVDDRRAVLVIWGGVVLLIAGVVLGPHATPANIVTTLVIVSTLVCAAGLAITVRDRPTS
jgi:O-antigen/teichoic acid export membrane protein